MINRIIYFSISHKFIVFLLIAAIIGGGIYALSDINIDSTPDITNNQVQVITVSENLSTSDIEQFVTCPVELAMSNLPGVEDIRSVSRFGLSVVTLIFKDQMDTYLTRQLVHEKLEEVKEEIPEEFRFPEMGPITTGLGEIFQYTLTPKDTIHYTPQELRTIQDWIVKRQLALIPGVVEVNSFGGSIKQYEVTLNPERMNHMGISINEVFDALSNNNANTGGAYIEKNHLAHFVRGEGLIKSIDDIRNIVVKTIGGKPLLISDVAEEVRLGSQMRYGAFTQDGHEAVGGMVLMLKGSNSKKVIRAVKERMERVQKSLPSDIEIRPFLDRSNLISRTTGTITRNLSEGALVVILVLVLLLGNIRGGIITASVIPLSLLFAFILMRLFGVWANLMSLGAIDFGIIVDGAVIIVEGVVHEMESKLASHQHALTQTDMDNISYQSASTMMHSAFFGQLIILIVFMPILFLTGVSSKMFSPMAYTFSFAVLGAIILCLTYVPVVSALLMRPLNNMNSHFARLERKLENISKRLLQHITNLYHPVLRHALKNKRMVLVMCLLLLIATGIVFARMGGEFIPELDEGDIAMQTFLRPGSSLSETIQREEEVERLLLSHFPEIKTVCARIGVADIPTDPMGFDYTDSFIILEKDRSKWTSARSKDELIGKIKEKLETLPGLNFTFSQPVALRFNELLTGIREDVAVKLYGEDLDKLNELGEQMKEIISHIPGAGDVSLEQTLGLPQITVRYDRKRVAQYGLDIRKLNQSVSTAFAGSKAGVVFEGEKRFDLVIRLCEEYRRGIDNLRQLYIDIPGGARIPLSEVAEIDFHPGPMQISRDKASRHIYVGVNVRGKDVQSLVADIQQQLDKKIILPTGYHIEYGGEFENLNEAKSRMMMILPLAMLVIFILLYLALGSIKESVIICLAVPLATIGGIFALVLRGMSFSISAGVGFIVLFGVAVLNGLVLINRFNSLKEEGVDEINKRIMLATQERLRPILLTATAAIFGFLPMAISTSAGAEVQRPLATVVIGGLFTATLLTLIVIPVVYALEENLKLSKYSRLHSLPVLFLISAISVSTNTYAQRQVSLEEALKLAEENYPVMRSARLKVSREKTMLKGVNNIGETDLSTGGEEIGHGNDAVYTLLQVRQNLNILGNRCRKRYQRQAVSTAEAAAELSFLKLHKQVCIAYSNAWIARQRMEVYTSIDSIYRRFEHAAKVKYEARETSHLEYLTARKKALETDEDRREAEENYRIAVIQLSEWLGDNYEPSVEPKMLMIPIDSIDKTPQMRYMTEQLKLSDANISVQKADGLPSFYVEGGTQKIGNKTGFWTFNVGINIQLFRGSNDARSKAARIDREIVQANYEMMQMHIEKTRDKGLLERQKWERKLQYFRETALPTAREQQRGAEAAYRLGATDYLGFIQTMGDAIKTELEYWDAYEQFMNNNIEVKYIDIQE